MPAKRPFQTKLLSAILVVSGMFCLLSGLPGRAGAQTITPLQPLSPQQAEAYQDTDPRAAESDRGGTGQNGRRVDVRGPERPPEQARTQGTDTGRHPEGKNPPGEEGTKRRQKRTGAGAGAAPAEREKRIAADSVRERSLFERSRQVGNYQQISVDLKPFGYDFFRKAAVEVVPERRDTPVPMNYVLGPGDEIRILLWGRVNAQHNLTVDREGKITIPQIGPLSVAGMTVEQMSKFLIQQVEQIVGTNVDVSVGSVRTIPIFVLGDVRRPGSYTIGSLATVTDALLMAGGPSEIGSMRKVQVRRSDKVITTFDLYDLFLKGDKSRDVVLLAGDVVFVPVAGPLAGIAGNVRRPAVYELENVFDLQHLIDLAGGILPSAYTQQIQVERIVRNEKQVVIDVSDKKLDKVRHFTIQDADLVKIFTIVEADENAVYLSGNVKRPGKYAYKPGMKMKDLIKDTEDLQRETHFDYALIKRLNPPQQETVLVPFNLGKLLLQDDAANNYELRPKDHVYVFSKWFFKEKPFVVIEGEIRGECAEAQADLSLPGARKPDKPEESLKKLSAIEDELKKAQSYPLLSRVREIKQELGKGRPASGEMRTLQSDLERMGRPEMAEKLQEVEAGMKKSCSMGLTGNMKIKDAILNAGGVTNSTSMERGEVVRVDAMKEYTTLYFNVQGALADDPRDNLALQDEDRIVLHSVWEQVYKKSVNVDGEVTRPGDYQYTEKMTVQDLLFKAGNVLESAYLGEAEITSLSVESGATGKVTRRNINLKKALEGDPAHNPVLAPYDRLFVKRIPEWRELRFAYLSGEVRFPGNYPIRKGERLSSLIERAGGFTDKAYLRGAYFTRERVRQLQQASLEDMTLRMERELLAEGAMQVSTSLSAEEVAAKKVELEQKKMLVESLRKLKATGRMTVRMAHLKALKDSEYDIELENGDALRIPEKNSVVNVAGARHGPGQHRLFGEDELRGLHQRDGRVFAICRPGQRVRPEGRRKRPQAARRHLGQFLPVQDGGLEPLALEVGTGGLHGGNQVHRARGRHRGA